KFNLENEGSEVVCAYYGNEATDIAESEEPALILLGLMLREMVGNEVWREIGTTKMMPLIMVTAKDSEIARLIGLTLDAVDNVTKPFSNREIIARVKANLRRQQQVQESAGSEKKDIHIGNLPIHPEAYSVSRDGAHIDLTHREFELFYYLARHIGQVMTRED